jgi:hypothetical protein
MTDRAGDAQRVGGRGKLIVAVIVLLVVVGVVWFALGRDDMRATPLEQGPGGDTVTAMAPDPTDADPGLAAEAARPQGREAPDSNEGEVSAQAVTGAAAGTGRNAPAPAGADRQSAPDGSLTEGPGREPSAPTRP